MGCVHICNQGGNREQPGWLRMCSNSNNTLV
jgi:hypothetical protein